MEGHLYSLNIIHYAALAAVLRKTWQHTQTHSPLVVYFETVLAPSMQRFTVWTSHSKPYIIKIVSYCMTAEPNRHWARSLEPPKSAFRNIVKEDKQADRHRVRCTIMFNIPCCCSRLLLCCYTICSAIGSSTYQMLRWVLGFTPKSGPHRTRRPLRACHLMSTFEWLM